MAQNIVFSALAAIFPLIAAQQIGTQTPEVNPSLPTWKCTTSGGCVQQSTSITLDYNYHWIHTTNGSTSCTTSSGINSTLCPDEATCSKNCVIEGVSSFASAGVAISGDALTLHQYVTTDGVTSNASPRVYLLGQDGNYEMLQLLGQELRFDVDASTLVCGENGALYLSEMDKTGGANQYNPGGASYGSGYCDAQCPVQTWRNGTIDGNTQGYCCNEMDIWEANANATALTPHPCENDTCDKGGCGFNPYAQGNPSYYGNGGTVDTLKPISVITQFITSDNTTTGTLSEIRRLYIQNGKVIQNAVSTSTGLDSITSAWCSSSDATAASLGGLTTMGQALGRGMVLIFSIWNDNGQFMSWLDSGSNGPCSSTAGNPANIETETPGTYVTFSNIRWGDIGSTFSQGGGSGPGSSSSSSSKTSSTTSSSKTVTTSHPTTTTSKPASTTTSTSGPTQSHWGQCGGVGWAGPVACAAPYTCQTSNPYYSQCL